MQVSTKFSVSIHILLMVAMLEDKEKLTSDFIAGSVNTNPVVIRKLMSLLKKAGLVEVLAGTGGMKLSKNPDAFTLLDIYSAVEIKKKDDIFKIHQNSEEKCVFGRNIINTVSPFLNQIQKEFEEQLSKISFSQIMQAFKQVSNY